MTTTPAAHIRTWANRAGLAVRDRGRLSPDIVAAYHDAHATAPPSGGDAAAARPEQPGTHVTSCRTVGAKQHWDWPRREAEAGPSS